MISNMPKPHTIHGIQALRALAAIMIVVFHAGGSVASDKYQGIGTFAHLTGHLTSGVDLFFVISGFVISFGVFERGQTKGVAKFALDRILRIYPLAMLTAGIYALSNFLLFSRDPDVSDLLSSFLLLPSPHEPIPIVLWTLKQELLFYGIFTIIIFNRSLGIWLMLVWILASYFVDNDHFLFAWLLNAHNIQFGMGVFAAYLYSSRKKLHSYEVHILPVGITIFFVASYLNYRLNFNVQMSAASLGLSALILTYGAAVSQIQIHGSILFLGAASYSIYLIHFFFVSAINKVLVQILPSIPGVLAILLLSALATLCGAGYFLLAEKPLEKWRKTISRKLTTKKLTGSIGVD